MNVPPQGVKPGTILLYTGGEMRTVRDIARHRRVVLGPSDGFGIRHYDVLTPLLDTTYGPASWYTIPEDQREP